MLERVQKIIAHSGVCSRRDAETLIETCQVTVNGKVIKIGDKADAATDDIRVQGERIKTETPVYYALNKPKEYLVTAEDTHNRRTIYDLPSVRKIKERIVPVGRLDMMSEGLLLLTNDGTFANKMAHPRYEVEKTYHVRIEPGFDKQHLGPLENGIVVEGRKTSRARVRILSKNELEITIHEGRNRIIRNMMDALGYRVFKLARVAIGELRLGALPPGSVYQLHPTQLKLMTQMHARKMERRSSPRGKRSEHREGREYQRDAPMEQREGRGDRRGEERYGRGRERKGNPWESRTHGRSFEKGEVRGYQSGPRTFRVKYQRGERGRDEPRREQREFPSQSRREDRGFQRDERHEGRGDRRDGRNEERGNRGFQRNGPRREDRGFQRDGGDRGFQRDEPRRERSPTRSFERSYQKPEVEGGRSAHRGRPRRFDRRA